MLFRSTAILKSIYQTILVAATMENDYNKILDLGLRTNLIPQLENLQPSTLETIINIFFMDPWKFFQKIHSENINQEKFKDDFRIFLKFINLSPGHTEQSVIQFLNNTMSDQNWEDLKKKHTPMNYDLPILKKSLEELRKSSTLI